MAQTDVGQTTTTNMDNQVQNFTVDSQALDEPFDHDDNYWDNPHWNEYLGYYKEIPELKKAIDALADWTVGKGVNADMEQEVILEHISGWGEDTFQNVMWNMIVTKKVNGDAYAEIIRDGNTLVNLKPLNPRNMRVVVDKKGIIKRYEELNRTRDKAIKKFKPDEILHLSNDRIANEIHGVSVVEACKWIIDARNEAMSDWRRILHRNLAGLRVIEVDEDDTNKLNSLKTQWKDAINKGEVLILPKGTASPVNTQPPTNPENWIRYLENFFYQAVGVPKIILGGTNDTIEASSKIGYLVFEQVYMSEQRLLEADLWNQLGLKIEFERPVSLKDDVVESEAKNTSQVGFQQNDVQAQVGRTE
jgi:hypothetical protein